MHSSGGRKLQAMYDEAEAKGYKLFESTAPRGFFSVCGEAATFGTPAYRAMPGAARTRHEALRKAIDTYEEHYGA